MKTMNIFFCITLLTATTVSAQPQQAPNKEKMKAFAGWAGTWEGEGWMQMGPGEPKKSKVVEQIEPKLDGTVYLVEGIGKALDPKTNQEVVVHHALALLSYDQVTGEYKFNTHLKDGRSTAAWLKTTGENKFQWGFDIPGRGQTRYSIILDPVKKTWNEIGEYSADGNNWSKFFEMNLTKKN